MAILPPANEEQRCEILSEFHILDTPPERDYDDMVGMLADSCRAPIAYIALLDRDRLWIKAGIGMAEAEVPRDHAFCVHGMAQADGLLVVRDTAGDRRFSGNPRAIGPHGIRSFAAAALSTREGLVMGSLVVADHTPRDFDEAQLRVLHALSRQVMVLLYLRRELLVRKALEDTLQRCESANVALNARLDTERDRSLETQQLAHVGSWEVDLASREGVWSPEMSRLVNHDPGLPAPNADEIAGLIHPDDRPAHRALRDRIRGGEDDLIFDYRTNPALGTERRLRATIHVNRDRTGAPVRAAGSVLDVTETWRAMTELRANEERYRLLFTGNPQPMWVWDRESFRFLAVNEAAISEYGYSLDEFLGMTVLDIRAPEDRIDLHAARALRPEEGKDHGYRFHCRKDGSVREMEIVSQSIEFNGQPARLVMTHDVTERRRTERKLREQAALLDQARDAIIVRDMEQRVRYWNKGAEQLYGWTAEEAAGRSMCELLDADREACHMAVARLLSAGDWTGELEHKHKEGKGLVVAGHWSLMGDEGGRPSAILSIHTDITERKKLEKEFQRAQRMESIGTLAGGIAHDLNNLLAPIMMGVELLRQRALNPENQAIIDNIERSARRGASLVKQVLSFARGVEGARVAVHCGHLVREIESIMENTFPKNIRRKTMISPDLWLVMGDPTQLTQILLNLCVNARDAMPAGGRLEVSAANVTLDEQYAKMNREMKPGRFVRIEVSDTGIGMDPGIIEHIFDPFFTTKEKGQGTGLGLSTLLGIVRSYGGSVNVYSEPGKGSAFKVYLPAQTSEAETAVDREPAKPPRGRGECVLLVDDEPAVLDITQQTLEAFGYQVLTASNGVEAIGLYARHHQKVAVVVTDVMMPVMDGPTLIASLRHIDASVRLIAMSGLPANGQLTRMVQPGVKHFLPKPFLAEALLRLLRDVLGGVPSAGFPAAAKPSEDSPDLI